jgi:hypothetical protein
MQSQIHSNKGGVRIAERAQPLLRQRAPEIQPYRTLARGAAHAPGEADYRRADRHSHRLAR